MIFYQRTALSWGHASAERCFIASNRGFCWMHFVYFSILCCADWVQEAEYGARGPGGFIGPVSSISSGQVL